MAQMQGGGPKPYLKDDIARTDNAADGPFTAQPYGTQCLLASYCVASPRLYCILILALSKLLVWPSVAAPPCFVRDP